VFLHPGQNTTSLNIGDSGKIFSVKWFDPRNGGDLQNGPVESVTANGFVKLGIPPSNPEMDWVVLLQIEN
jgi:hypothetical protein